MDVALVDEALVAGDDEVARLDPRGLAMIDDDLLHEIYDLVSEEKELALNEIMTPYDILSQDQKIIFVSAMNDLLKNAIIQKVRSMGNTGDLQPLI